jgi:ribonuclease HI
MKEVDIYTDGACSGNPGVGGWAAVLLYNEHKKQVSGYDKQTTNNRMELFAVIMGLRNLKEKCKVKLYTDSAYVADAFNKGWSAQWQQSGWKTAGKDEVKNQDMWKALLFEVNRHDVTFVKVKGHSDDEYNNKCDKLARGEVEKHLSPN